MIEETMNKDLMCDVYKHQVVALKQRVRSLEVDNKVLINKLLKTKPELKEWVKLNFGEKK